MKYIITLTFFLYSTGLLAQWQPDIQLNDNPVRSNITHNKTSIVASGDVLHVVWYEKHGEDYQIYYKRSINKGATWQTAKRITNNTLSTYEPVLSVSGDIVNIFWRNSFTDMYQTRSVNAGISWSPEKKLTDATDAYNSPYAAVSGSIIHLVWSGKIGQIFYKRSTNGGSTWDATVELSDRHASSMPAIAVSDKEVHVVWQEKAEGSGGSAGIFHKRSVDAGKNWKADNKLSYETSDFASIAVSGKEVYVTWRDNHSKSIYIRNSPDGGINWRNNNKLTNYSDFASVAVSGQFVHLVWKSSTNLNYKRSINGGVTWEPETPIPNSAGSPRAYSLVANGQRIDLVWDNGQNAFYKRLLKQSAKKDFNPKGQNTTSPDEENTDEKKDEQKTEGEKPIEKKKN